MTEQQKEEQEFIAAIVHETVKAITPLMVSIIREMNGPDSVEKDELDDIPIRDMNLSVRAVNVLKILGVRTVGELVNMTENDLMKCRCMGKKSLLEIKESLGKMDLSLRMSPFFIVNKEAL
jgi:DNA-directed RNA polymerase subunit alpha